MTVAGENSGIYSSKMSQIDGIATCTWNANELIGKIPDLREFINIHKTEVMLIQETHLIGTDKIYILNYTFYSTPSHTVNYFTQVVKYLIVMQFTVSAYQYN